MTTTSGVILLAVCVAVASRGVAAGLGDPCDASCTAIENSFCKDSTTCACQDAFVESADKKTCLPKAGYIYAPCVEDLQCTSVFEGSIACINNKCDCSSGYHFVAGKCWIHRLLGEPCEDSNECVLPDFPERVECKAKVCVCKGSFQPNEDNSSCKNGAGLNSLTIFSIVPALLAVASRLV